MKFLDQNFKVDHVISTYRVNANFNTELIKMILIIILLIIMLFLIILKKKVKLFIIKLFLKLINLILNYSKMDMLSRNM